MPVKKILIIDDSPTERYILTEILNRGGYQGSSVMSLLLLLPLPLLVFPLSLTVSLSVK